MKVRERVVVAMSGGVDSSVAAARLHAAGHEVVGVTLHLWDYPRGREGHGRCCAPEDQHDARRVADTLGFAHFTFDRRSLFAEQVVGPFVDAYLSGETPSPCAACNRGVKLGELMDIADRLGARTIATGHYARVVREPGCSARLARAADERKDQSYFLYATPSTLLERLAFPLGDATKPEVRAEAVALGLPGAGKGESQELCFVEGGAHAYAGFVEARAGDRVRPGLVVDDEGRPVGRHAGFHRFTVGQRRGVGVAVGRPSFVTRIDPRTATVHVGEAERLLSRTAHVEALHLAEGVSLPLRADVRFRYRHQPVRATVRSAGPCTALVELDEPVRAVAPGQIAVFYERDVVLGGGKLVASPSRDALAS